MGWVGPTIHLFPFHFPPLFQQFRQNKIQNYAHLTYLFKFNSPQYCEILLGCPFLLVWITLGEGQTLHSPLLVILRSNLKANLRWQGSHVLFRHLVGPSERRPTSGFLFGRLKGVAEDPIRIVQANVRGVAASLGSTRVIQSFFFQAKHQRRNQLWFPQAFAQSPKQLGHESGKRIYIEGRFPISL